MKTQVLILTSFKLAAITLACASAEVGATSAGIRGSLIRNVPMNELASEVFHVMDIRRRLDENNGEGHNNDNGEEAAAAEAGEVDAEEEERAAEEEAAEEEDQAAWQEVEDMQYADEEDESTTTYQSKRARYEAQAAQLFETAPKEWNAGQWDLLFALFGTILVTCCVLSAFFAYCCIFREDDDVDISKERRSHRRRIKKKDDETVASDYTREVSLLPDASGSRTFSPRSWVSSSSFMSGKKNAAAEKRNANSYSAPIASYASGEFAQVCEAPNNVTEA